MTKVNSSVEQARRELVQIAQQIQGLARTAPPPQEYFTTFLALLGKAVGARAGVVWRLNPDGRLTPLAESRYAETGIPEDGTADGANQLLVRETFTTGQARYLKADHESCTRFPKPTALIVAPLQDETACVGVVELFQPPGATDQARGGYLQFVEQMAGYASEYLAGLRERSAQTGDDFWHELAELTLRLQSSLNPAEVASVAANDGRLLLDCDRLSVVCKRGSKLIVECVSGQDAVNHRSNLVRSMRKLATRILPTKTTFSFRGKTAELPQQIAEPLADFVAEGGARRLTMIPLFPAEPLVTRKPEGLAKPPEADGKRAEPFGCLVVEELAGSDGGEELARRAELLSDHVGAALANARAHRRIFLRPLFSAIGNCREWLFGRTGLKLAAAAVLIAVLVMALVLIPYEYRVEAEGRLMPVVQQAVYAPWDGEIKELYVAGGQRVKKGQKLLKIFDPQLQEHYVGLTRELDVNRAEERVLRARIDDARRTPEKEDEIRLEGQLAETRARSAGLATQINTLKSRIDELTLRSPISGVVSTFRVKELLKGRPVQRGEVLIEIADDKGAWRLELEVEEHRMGHLLRAQRDRRPERLPVEFVLATDPTETYDGRLDTVATRPKRVPERGSLVEMYGTFPKRDPLRRRIGAEIRAKISCGKRSLGYVLFGDVIEFVQSRWWL